MKEGRKPEYAEKTPDDELQLARLSSQIFVFPRLLRVPALRKVYVSDGCCLLVA